jgi:hypothetical protein
MSSAPPPRVSAREASLLVCSILRLTLALSESDLTPEMIRRCKANNFAVTTDKQPSRSGEEQGGAEEQTEAAALDGLWKCMHQCVQLQRLDPIEPAQAAASLATSNSAAAPAPLPPLSLRELQLAWEQRASDLSARELVAQSMRRWNYPPARRRLPSSSHSLSSSQQQSAQMQRLLHMSARECLLALHWLIGHVRLLDRFVTLLAHDSAHAWFAATPSSQHAVAIRQQQDAAAAPRIASAPFPLPVLPPAAWDSAGCFSGTGYLEQSDEYKLLQQMLKEADARVAEAGSAAASAAAVSSSSIAALCLPLPSSQSAVTQHASYSDRRLAHRMHQCVALHGRLQERLRKLAETAPEHARLLVSLQQLQRHPCLRGKASPYSPFELQLLRHASLRNSYHSSLQRWLQSLPPSLLLHDLHQSLSVWHSWMASVSQLQQQEDQQREAEELGGGAALHTQQPHQQAESDTALGELFATARARGSMQSHPSPGTARTARGAPLPPHMRNTGRPSTGSSMRSPEQTPNDPSRALSSSTSRASLDSPAISLWRAISHPAGSIDLADDACSDVPTLPSEMLQQWTRSQVGSYALTTEERAWLQSHTAVSSVAPAHAHADVRSIRWVQDDALEPLLQQQRDLSVACKLSFFRFLRALISC